MRSLRLSSSAAVAREHHFWMSFLKGRTNPDGGRRTEVDSRPRLPVRDPEGRLQRRSARITHQPEVGRRHADLSLPSDPSSLVTTRPVSRILCSSRQMRDFIAFFRAIYSGWGSGVTPT